MKRGAKLTCSIPVGLRNARLVETNRSQLHGKGYIWSMLLQSQRAEGRWDKDIPNHDVAAVCNLTNRECCEDSQVSDSERSVTLQYVCQHSRRAAGAVVGLSSQAPRLGGLPVIDIAKIVNLLK